MPKSNWNPEEEERYMLQLVPLMKEINDFAKSKLPPGTDFGFIVLVPPPHPDEEGRVIALSTDRKRVARGAAEWFLNTREED